MCIFHYNNRTAYFVCFQVGDKSGELTARLNLSDLQMVLGLSYSTNNSMMAESHAVDTSLNGKYMPISAVLANSELNESVVF